MRQRRPTIAAVLAMLVPQFSFALEPGVVGMQTAEELERQNIGAWAYSELIDALSGMRHQLEPLLPPPPATFSILDAEIKAFIVAGQHEQARIIALIENIEMGTPLPDPVVDIFIPSIEAVASNPPPTVFTSVENFGDNPPLEVYTSDDGKLVLDTTGSIDLPDMTIDPRDGGEYTSELAALQSVLDVVQVAQDKIPAPIQTTANTLYDNLTGIIKSDD